MPRVPDACRFVDRRLLLVLLPQARSPGGRVKSSPCAAAEAIVDQASIDHTWRRLFGEEALVRAKTIPRASIATVNQATEKSGTSNLVRGIDAEPVTARSARHNGRSVQ